jgi:hypothetical protein
MMFNIFKKKSEVDQLEKKYKKLLEESYKLSKINRTQSDAKKAEAEDVLNQIEALRAKKKK